MNSYQTIKDIENQLMVKLEESSYIDTDLYKEYNIKRGLRNSNGTGVLVGITKIANVIGYDTVDDKIIPIEGKLLYRGIDLNNIVDGFQKSDRFGFEETAYLLLIGNLPSTSHLENFKKILEYNRKFPKFFNEDVIFKFPSSNVMNMLQKEVLSLYSYDHKPEDLSLVNTFRQSINLIAKLPILMVYSYQAMRHYYDNESLIIHRPKTGASTAENILHMLRPDSKYTDQEAKLLDLCMVVHAEHGGGNNSSFATHVVSSTGTDTYSAISTAIGSLKGPKHGGANLMVNKMVDNIKENCNWRSKNALSSYLDKILDMEAFDKKGLVYGMGHAVYTKSDPRAVLLKSKAKELAISKGFKYEFELLENIEKMTIDKLKERKGPQFEVCANVDLYSGLVYRMLDIDENLFTPIFAVSRMAGWCAHRLEQIRDEKIMRPGYASIIDEQEYIPLLKR